jgi:light-harvesting complex I chlorophyll a/b binding protein 1
LAQWAPDEHLRAAELANGRSAMLATVGWVFPRMVGTFDGPVDTTDPIEAFFKSDAQWWAQFIVFCAVIEGIKLRGEMEGKSFTGEVGKEAALDWTNNWSKMDDAKKEEMAMKELKNGRLAMIGIASFASNYWIAGSVPGLSEGF